MRKRFRRSAKAVAQWCQQHRHNPVEDQAAALNAKLRGHYQYDGRPTNYRGLWRFYRMVRRLWHTWLNRRTRGKTLDWPRFAQLLGRYPLLPPRIMPCLGWVAESWLRNRMQQSCMFGSVRGEAAAAMANLHGHATGNGGHGQGDTYRSGRSSPTRKQKLTRPFEKVNQLTFEPASQRRHIQPCCLCSRAHPHAIHKAVPPSGRR